MGVPFCKMVDWFCEACAKLFMWRTKMNFWYMRLLTEFLMLFDEMDSTKFLFSCCVCVSRVVLEKMGFSCENRCLSVSANKWLWKVLEKWFWDGWNLNFSVGYDRVKCQERVGENDTEMVKAEKTENLCCQTSTAVCMLARAVHADRTSVFSFFVLFLPISVLNWPLT